MKHKPHKYDPGTYVCDTFTGPQRKRKTWLLPNYIRAQALAARWKRRTGNGAVVQLTMFNTEIGVRPKWLPNPARTRELTASLASTPMADRHAPCNQQPPTSSGGASAKSLTASASNASSTRPVAKSGADFYTTLDKAYQHAKEPNMRIQDQHDPMHEPMNEPSNRLAAWRNPALLIALWIALVLGAFLWTY